MIVSEGREEIKQYAIAAVQYFVEVASRKE
jgi:hypothetical protein